MKKPSRSQILFGACLLVIFCSGAFSLLPRKTSTAAQIDFFNGRKVEFRATVVEVDERLGQIKLTVDALEVFHDKSWRPVRGKVLLSLPLFPKFHYGDYLEVAAKLQTPAPIENFQYDKYLARYDIYSVCYQPQSKRLAENRGNFFLARIYNFRDRIRNLINGTISEPAAALLAGILIGDRAGLPPSLSADFARVGVTHIIAISGYNISVLGVFLLNFFIALGVNRKRAYKFIVVVIFLFVILTGASASVVRAAIMGIIVLSARQFGRQSEIKNVLALTAAVMLALNPKILFYDAGFQLSFISTLGLIYLSPILTRAFQFVPEKFGLRENLATTMAAIIATEPLIVSQFGRVSLVAPIVNLLVLPFIPMAMATGAMQILGGALFLPLGKIIGWSSWLVLNYVIRAAEFFGSQSFAAVNFSLPPWSAAVGYGIIMGGMLILKSKSKFNGKETRSKKQETNNTVI